MTSDDIKVEFWQYKIRTPDEEDVFYNAVQNCIARGNIELREALLACVEVMSTLPTLDGSYGVAVLEHARGLLELSAITDDVTNGMLQAGAEVLGAGRGTTTRDTVREIYKAMRAVAPRRPVDMVLYCPNCLAPHIDAPEPPSQYAGMDGTVEWTNPPHRSHLCGVCGWQWRPSDAPTNGVAAPTTRGKADSAGVPAMVRDAARWRYCKRPGFFALPPSKPGDVWAVGIGDTRASNSFYGPTQEAAIDAALEHETTHSTMR